MNDMRLQTLADVEREYILATLEACQGNRTRAAEMLGISIRCLRNRLHLFAEVGIRVSPPKSGVGSSVPDKIADQSRFFELIQAWGEGDGPPES
jgi:hypothetical protein